MRNCRGFTIVELLVVIGIIGVLIAILLPALSTVRGAADMSKSQNNMRQTFVLMRDYASGNRDTIVPSLFDRTDPASTPTPGKVRSDVGKDGFVGLGRKNMGTWADILWTHAGFGPLAFESAGSNVVAFRTETPDSRFYTQQPGFDRNPFRAAVPALSVWKAGLKVSEDPKINSNEFGSLFTSEFEPGLFAANNFFDSRPASAVRDGTLVKMRGHTNHFYDSGLTLTDGTRGRPELSTAAGTYFNFGQIIAPDASMYLIDSLAAETIDPVDGSFTIPESGESSGQVAFRYNGESCCMLLLDGQIRSESKFVNLTELEGFANIRDTTTGARTYESEPDKMSFTGRGVRLRHLDLR